MYLKILFCVILTSELVKAPHSWQDFMGLADKKKMITLAEELMVDSKLKMRQLIEVVEDHSSFDGYHYGYIIGRIREEYSLMVELYKTAKNRLDGFQTNLILPPNTKVVRPIHYIHYMHEIHLLEKDIDELVRLIEKAPKDAVKLGPGPIGDQPNALRSKDTTDKKRLYRNREELNWREKLNRTKLTILERKLKSKYREEHLMRRIGLPVNTSTTRKRFIDRWPVEDTWTLNDYETVK